MKRVSIYLVFCISLILMLLMINSVSAITGSIGNARMILRAEQREVIEKSILVKNVNNESIDIEMTPSGDLEDYIDIDEEKFSLNPGESKKVYFTIKAAKPGTTESKINIQFLPKEGKNGVGLSSTIILITEEKGFFEGVFGGDDEENQTNIDLNESQKSSGITGNVIGRKTMILGGLLMISLFLILLLVLAFYLNKSKKSDLKK